MSLDKTLQFNEYLDLAEIKPEVSKNGIFFPIFVDHINLNKYHGDARSFGYDFDEGPCTVVAYQQVVGVLAEDTIDLFDRCAYIKKYLRKPSTSILEFEHNESEKFNRDNSELLIRYDNNYFYKDAKGYWFESYSSTFDFTVHDIEPTRVTTESGDIYREANKEYQRNVRKYNELMTEALNNMKLLKEIAKNEG